MELLQTVFFIFAERSAFFLQLMIEHLWISGAAIGIAIVLGGAAGILIHRYERAAAPTLGMVNFSIRSRRSPCSASSFPSSVSAIAQRSLH